MKEKAVERYLVEQAERRGWLIYKLSPTWHAGLPDRMLISPKGRVVFVELKSMKGVLSFQQQVLWDEWAARGVFIRILRTIEGVDAFFEDSV